ncbi:enoyl-CoA hydratase/isomerase family protein [Chitinimonas sp. BJB300]|uniref:enoyl-CoA hydratase/isomerase family protein n=1 Tax=Chitinimonas sp. BJB300 TaxID=1559339 RepID=UPI000C0F4C5C|nr:enoyl-CoA hydratase/isomerase family protein [Chitinimonas sp. BJB300]PHV12399.1 enoyl-CoA hydratase [Chitinimonas sp. BJB300]TSJ88995.1 enoyl-CoA hydratase/isomerase family protein [Chitinimonas sp. BJB300]
MTDAVYFTLIPTDNGHHIGQITLNAEKSLNALSLVMIRQIAPKLEEWKTNPGVVCIVLRGVGEKAFCAGGDVVSLHDAIKARDFATTDAFFKEEYALDYAIHNYPKPILVWGHGIVMGGGVGLMAGASHRVVTERSRIAMPEITIGLYPDVGASWFLNRLPGRLGLYLGLTGASFNAADALFVDLADFALPSTQRDAVLGGLMRLDWQAEAASNHYVLGKYLREHSRHGIPELAPSPIREHLDVIRALTSYEYIEEMVDAICRYDGQDDWLRKGAQRLSTGSPTSVRLVLAAQQRARHMSLVEVFAMELNISRQCCRHPDFAEGVRALLVEKDNTPRWSPATLAEVSQPFIDAFFIAP